MFDGDWNKRILDEELANNIYNSGVILGRSQPDNSCYWKCYMYNEKYYIGLNDEDIFWLVEKSDIDDYNEIPN